MNHKPIFIDGITLSIGDRTLFENFSTHILPGQKIVIMGTNGTGKSTLLKILQGIEQPTLGSVKIDNNIVVGYVPQTIEDHPTLSGGQRFNKALSKALSLHPNMLFLDEPTNHLDAHNKRSLIRMLGKWNKTLVIVSHDPNILSLDFDEIWHIQHGSIEIFKGNYEQYLEEHTRSQTAAQKEREKLTKEKRKLKRDIQQERKRTAQSRRTHKDEKDRNLLGSMKERGSRSTGITMKRLSKTQENIQEKLSNAYVHKIIKPTFNLQAGKLSSGKAVISIINGSCGYKKPILSTINLELQPTECIAISGDNGSGKSTLLKAILNNPHVLKTGTWHTPEKENIGYLDQHYSTLNPDLTIFQVIQRIAPTWANGQIRKHLNDFLFSSQHDVSKKVAYLSGGEKARLSLAVIAAQNPALLLFDEITNNVDRQTRAHIIDVLKEYPGAMIIVSHDSDFLNELDISTLYESIDGKLERV